MRMLAILLIVCLGHLDDQILANSVVTPCCRISALCARRSYRPTPICAADASRSVSSFFRDLGLTVIGQRTPIWGPAQERLPRAIRSDRSGSRCQHSAHTSVFTDTFHAFLTSDVVGPKQVDVTCLRSRRRSPKNLDGAFPTVDATGIALMPPSTHESPQSLARGSSRHHQG